MNLTTFNSFKNKNFRLFFSGQFISLLGTWMQKTAVSWLVYSLTQSKFMLGVSVFATLFPTALFSLYGGIVADRYDRYKILLITQIVSLFQAILMTLAVVFFKENIVWWIISLSAMLGIINGFDIPARQSLVRELIVDKTDLPNALALNSSMVNLSKLIGPAIAGFVLERFGDAICFGSNAVSFIAVLISLFLMQLPKQEIKPKADKNLKKEFAEAFLFIKNTPAISSAIFFTGLMGLLVLPFSTLTPVFAKDIFRGSASTLGVVDGVIGLGAFLGALFLASLKQGTNLTQVLAKNTFLFGIGLLLFSQTNFYPLALLFLLFGSFGMMSVWTITNTIVQVNVHNEFRGRVISIYLMILTATVPIGSLLVGSVSHYIGVQTTILIQAILAMIISVFYIIYLRKKE
ncbi:MULTISPECIES: MFS transporter [unclassified Flavobacterium]|jgi:MFS family permease|uniref:MFS transporter n=2 Tax=Flavobacterium TaxID=237 RepID=UPI0025C16521|nr:MULTISPECIES: MFS transporter [unclassified Flavobacterium]